MSLNTIGIIGNGHFGQFLVTLLTRFMPDVSVRVHSKRSKPDGVRYFSLADTAEADVVILCGTIASYEEQLLSIKPYLRSETVVVDVATVKVYTEKLCQTILGNQPYVCLHPMFGPESYRIRAEDVTGLRIVVTASTLSAQTYETVRGVLAAWGFLVISMTSDEHDKLLAETLFLTHYVSQAVLAQPGESIRSAIDTPSYHALLQAVESVKNDYQLFRDVYRFNPYCQGVADRFHRAETKLWESLQNIE